MRCDASPWRTGLAMMALGVISTSAIWTDDVAAQVEEYQVRFTSTWSAQTHPMNFPPNPHYSGLIGGTHGDQVTFWEVGELASPGIKRMAETGSKSPLDDEVQAAIDAGLAGTLISGGGIGSSPGMVTETFLVDQSFPLVTVVSMLAPSPDWFVGVSGVSLFENGEWVDIQVIELHVYDAGTDSGMNYTSPNDPTVPPVPIFEKTDGPFANGVPVGTFVFSRTSVAVPEDPLPDTPLVIQSVGPNPTSGSSTVRFTLDRTTQTRVGIFDVGGRQLRVLVDDNLSSGSHAVAWDGRLAGGAPAPAGTYFWRLAAAGRARVGKVVLSR